MDAMVTMGWWLGEVHMERQDRYKDSGGTGGKGSTGSRATSLLSWMDCEYEDWSFEKKLGIGKMTMEKKYLVELRVWLAAMTTISLMETIISYYVRKMGEEKEILY